MKTGQLLIPYERCPALIPMPDFNTTVQTNDSLIPQGSEALIGFEGDHLGQRVSGLVFHEALDEMTVSFDDMEEVVVEAKGFDEYSSDQDLLNFVRVGHSRILAQLVATEKI